MTILLTSHYTNTPGIAEKYLKYLKKSHRVYAVQYPLYPTIGMKSKVGFSRTFTPKVNPYIQYFSESIVTYYYYTKSKRTKPIDIAICFDPLSFFNIYVVRKVLNINKMVYYNVDFSLERFKNPLMNRIYQWVNMFAFRNCDYFFCPTETFTQTLDPDGKYANKSYVIDHTIDVSAIKKPRKRDRSIVYAGSLQYSVNFKKVFAALESIKKENIDFHLDIYGDGPLKKDIILLTQKHNIEDNVTFKGIVANDKLVHEILPTYQIGICPYVERGDKHAKDHMFAGTNITSKIVEYFGAGLPTLTTRLTKKFDEVEKYKIGFLPKTKVDWYAGIKKLLTNKKLVREYSKNAQQYAKRFDVKETIEPILIQISRSINSDITRS